MQSPVLMLPLSFPCWCRATYSWGGESKKDLGFVEGDLIECLNAGDGSWWMGRLNRNKATGLFPSNFVELLSPDFRPQQGNPRTNQKSETPAALHSIQSYRRPFQAYNRPLSSGKSGTIVSKSTHTSGKRSSLEEPWESPVSSHVEGNKLSRRKVRYSPVDTSRFSTEYNDLSNRELSTVASSTPPPPPPHKIHYANLEDSQYEAELSDFDDASVVRQTNSTPSPLRDAIDDVMLSLQDMQIDPFEGPRDLYHEIQAGSPSYSLTRENHEILRRPKSMSHLAYKEQCLEDRMTFETDRTHVDQFHSGASPIKYKPRIDINLNRLNHNTTLDSDCILSNVQLGREGRQELRNPIDKSQGIYDEVRGSNPLRSRRSALELSQHTLKRFPSARSSITLASNDTGSDYTQVTQSTAMTSQSLMSSESVGQASATSAGSLARRKFLGHSNKINSQHGSIRPDTMATRQVLDDHDHQRRFLPDSNLQSRSQTTKALNLSGYRASVSSLTPRRSGFLRKLVDSAKAGAASTRGTISDGRVENNRRIGKVLSQTIMHAPSEERRCPGTVSGDKKVDWMQVRRDVNRSNSFSSNERQIHLERFELQGLNPIAPIETLYEVVQGDEDARGDPVVQSTDYGLINLSLVDKHARFTQSLPPISSAASVALGYLCRPYKSDLQKIRSIFIWISEKIAWDEDFDGPIDTRRVIQARRGCTQEKAVLMEEMCLAVGIHCETVSGHLKLPGESILTALKVHWWNSVVIDGMWRMIDCSLASPSCLINQASPTSVSQTAEVGYFLVRPTELCYSHIPKNPNQQHICPPVSNHILEALPLVSPIFFKNDIELLNFDTSQCQIHDLELLQISVAVPQGIECVAEVQTKSYDRDLDGDIFDTGETTTTHALSQARWLGGQKVYIIKAYLPMNESSGQLRVYAGKRGLMHSMRDNPHELAFTLPISHTGQNPFYEFMLRHPTPHAQRQDLYVSQPQCRRLALNNTFVFVIRQHPSATCDGSNEAFDQQYLPPSRPGSAMSTISTYAPDNVSQASSTNTNVRSDHGHGQDKPAKLAIQTPSGKIIRLMCKSQGDEQEDSKGLEQTWETIIKIGEIGIWRGLVFADRSARWCVFAEWEC